VAGVRIGVFVLCVAALGISGCAGIAVGGSAYAQPPVGFVFGNHVAPLEVDFEATSLGSKVGSARTRYLADPFFTGLPIAAWGQASVEAAAANGGITTVRYADYEVLCVLGIYRELEVRVSGD
jgi:hypothetical protein